MQNLTNQIQEPNPLRIQFNSRTGTYNLEDLNKFNALPTFILEIFGKQLTQIYKENLEQIFISKLMESVNTINRNYSCNPSVLQSEIQKLIQNPTLLESVDVEQLELESEVVSIESSPFVKPKPTEAVQELVSDVVSLESSPVVEVQRPGSNRTEALESVIESLVESPSVGITENSDICVKLNSYMLIPSGTPNLTTLNEFIKFLTDNFDGILEFFNKFDKKKLINLIGKQLKKIVKSESQYFEPRDGNSADADKSSSPFDIIHAIQPNPTNNFVLQVKTIDFLNFILLLLINNYIELNRETGLDVEILNKILKYVRPDKKRYPDEYFTNNPNLGTLFTRCKNL